ncbi:MAG: TrmB family transcriptional regulator [Chloroflexi bacterium]|nr:TrmB family transcriptional regulator [Chloroflexota bacterium]
MDLAASLMQIGFTEYEAKIYLELLRDSPATGYQLSKNAGIPRSMVYEALGRLHNRGAVLETRDERATLYRPLPPDVLLNEHEREYQSLVQGLRDGLRQRYTTEDEDHLWSISGRRAVLSYANQMINGADSEVLLVLADADLDDLRPAILKACDRKLAVSALLTGSGELNCGQVAYHPPLESELQNLTQALMVIVDQREALIANTQLETRATITRNPNLVLIARQFVWMELFTQRIYHQLGDELLARLSLEDQQIFTSLRR